MQKTFLVILYLLASCVAQETERLLFLRNFVQSVQTNDENSFHKMIFDDPRINPRDLPNNQAAESNTPQFKTISQNDTRSRNLYYSISSLKDELTRLDFSKNPPKFDNLIENKSFSIRSRDPDLLGTTRYSPVPVHFVNAKNETFLELILWETKTEIKTPAETTPGKNTNTTHYSYSVGNITFYQDIERSPSPIPQ